MSNRPVRVKNWPPPKGYENGILAEGQVLFVAGQVGWTSDGSFASSDLVLQFEQALQNVLDVVAAAGGVPADITRLTVYVTKMAAYRENLAGIGRVYRSKMGKHFPAMALLGVSELVEPQACVEIEATAVLPVSTNL